MELPILSHTEPPSSAVLVRAIGRAGGLLARTVAQETPLGGATAYCNPARDSVRCANYAADLRVPEGWDAAAVVDEIITFFQQQGARPLALETSDMTWSDALSAELERRGFQPVVCRVYLLEHHRARASTGTEPVQIIPARAAYRQLSGFYRSGLRRACGGNEHRADHFADTLIDHLDEPKLDLSVGRVDGHIRGGVGVISLGEIGVLYQPLTDHDQRDVATALVDHVLDVCARAGMKHVVLERTDGCPSIPVYESIGFKPVASLVRYQPPEA